MGRAGYMAIIIEGQSDKPVYLYINNDTVEIRDASWLWGKTISESIQLIEKECQVKGSTAAIEPVWGKTGAYGLYNQRWRPCSRTRRSWRAYGV